MQYTPDSPRKHTMHRNGVTIGVFVTANVVLRQNHVVIFREPRFAIRNTSHGVWRGHRQLSAQREGE